MATVYGTTRNYPSLTPRQEAVALLLASGRTIEAAAGESRCAAVTIKGWAREQPAFKERVREIRGELTERTLGLLADAAADAVLTLRELCRCGETESTRLKAADAILAHDRQHRETSEMRQQLGMIQEQLAGLDRARRVRR